VDESSLGIEIRAPVPVGRVNPDDFQAFTTSCNRLARVVFTQ
jgi:hypothetical protein